MSRLQKVDGPAGIGRNPAAPGRLGFRVAVVFRNVWFLAAVTAGTAVAKGGGRASCRSRRIFRPRSCWVTSLWSSSFRPA
ncbi:hypothetical protein SUDANB106_04262 [Streptomyces sp. enrichment culture]